MQNYIILKPIKNQNYVKKVNLVLNGKSKQIGKIDFAGDGTFTANKRNESHLFRKTNSLGLSYGLLKNESIKFKWIVIDYCGKKYVTSKEFLLKFGHVLHFNNYETQIFLPLNLFGINLVREFEKEEKNKPNQQQNLFGEIAA